jgi:hypothetical protein
MYAGYKPSLVGEPWDAWMDANLLEDYECGCSVLAMAHRCRRTEDEIEARLAELGKSMADQPKPNRRRTWTG